MTEAISLYSLDAARRAKAVLWDGVTLLSQFPRIARLLPDGKQRQWPAKFGVGSILIRYRIANDNTIVITRVIHGRENR